MMTSSLVVASSLPAGFSAMHLYSPSSSRCSW